MEKNKTYRDKLMTEKDSREKFDEECQNFCIGEQIARALHPAHLIRSICFG